MSGSENFLQHRQGNCNVNGGSKKRSLTYIDINLVRPPNQAGCSDFSPTCDMTVSHIFTAGPNDSVDHGDELF